MRPKFITKNIHAFLDYPVALLLIAAPFLLGLGQSSAMAFWLSVVTGVAALTLTLLTDHKLGVVRMVPYSVHLTIDAMVAAVFLVAPFVFGFAGLDAVFYWANGAAVAMVVGLHKSEFATEPMVLSRTAA